MIKPDCIDIVAPPSEKIKSTELERHVITAIKESPTVVGGRYGVKVSYQNGKLVPIPSYPDIEGVMRGGRQWICECKVVSGSSLNCGRLHESSKQFSHLMERSEFGALCFYLIHFNARKLKTKSEPATTFVVPVNPKRVLWQQVKEKSKGTLSRDDCHHHGLICPWIKPPRCRNPRIALNLAITALVQIERTAKDANRKYSNQHEVEAAIPRAPKV